MSGQDFSEQKMVDIAVAYFLAAERCAPDLAFGSYGVHSVSTPRITNYAFSIELILKLLLRGNTYDLNNTHDLKKLFALLPDETKERLGFVDELLQSDSQMATVFVDWRYSFEGRSLIVSPDDLRRAFIVCHVELRRQKPELVSVYEQDWGKFEPDWCWAWPKLEVKQSEALLRK